MSKRIPKAIRRRIRRQFARTPAVATTPEQPGQAPAPLTLVLGEGDLMTQLQMLEVEEITRLYERPAEKPSTPEQDAEIMAFVDHYQEKNDAWAAGESERWKLENPNEEESRARRERAYLIRLLGTVEARDAYLERVRAYDPGDGSKIREAEAIVAAAAARHQRGE